MMLRATAGVRGAASEPPPDIHARREEDRMQTLRPPALAFVVILTLGLSAAIGATPSAQQPKTGNAWYEDSVDLGFKVKAPKGWDFVPGSPLERNLVGKYTAGNGADVNLGHNAIVTISLYLVKFDRREQADEERLIGDKQVKFSVQGREDLEAWMERGMDQGREWQRLEKEDGNLKGALRAKTFVYEGISTIRMGGSAEPQPIRTYAAVFPLSKDVDIALVGTGPGDKRKWRKYQKAYQSLAKTLRPVEVEALAGATGKDPRSLKRAKLEAEVAKSPGWSLYETPNYFIISCYDDKGFIKELKLRLEAIRKVYEKDFPPSLARKLKKAPEGETGTVEGSEKEEDQHRTVAVIDTLELGKSSVVRVCKDREQYMSYGAPPGSGGYWSSMEEELVVYDDKANKGRDYTWGVLNHEGFHQYTYAFFGNLAPHTWYNEGIGDYYSGFKFNTKTKKFKEEKSVGRQDNLLLIRDKYVPLVDFVNWTKSQYYGSNSGNGNGGGRLEGWACYAQGWSLIWFLRTGKAGRAKGWKKEWDSILGTYTDVLLGTGDLEQACEAAFEGVDWEKLEASWADYMI
jgi:hypothetical protein